jgi:hypothetical protein
MRGNGYSFSLTALATGKFDTGDKGAESGAEAQREVILCQAWREDEEEAAALDQRGEAGNAEGHYKEAGRGPKTETATATGARADQQGNADDRRDADGGEPERAVKIEVANGKEEIPKKIAPQDDTACCQPCKITHARPCIRGRGAGQCRSGIEGDFPPARGTANVPPRRI